jgi:hypothetical protein
VINVAGRAEHDILAKLGHCIRASAEESTAEIPQSDTSHFQITRGSRQLRKFRSWIFPISGSHGSAGQLRKFRSRIFPISGSLGSAAQLRKLRSWIFPILMIRGMGVSPMSLTGVSPVAKVEETAGNTAKMDVLLTGETPVPRFLGQLRKFLSWIIPILWLIRLLAQSENFASRFRLDAESINMNCHPHTLLVAIGVP